MLVYPEEGKPENPEKNCLYKGRTKNKLNPRRIPSRNRTRPHWWEATTHHCAITDPQSNVIFQDNLVTLNVMLTSPHVADLKPLVETWITNLQEVENITDIWADCQKKVLAKSSVLVMVDRHLIVAKACCITVLISYG